MTRAAPMTIAAVAGLVAGGLLMLPATRHAAITAKGGQDVATARALETAPPPALPALPRGSAIVARDPAAAVAVLVRTLRGRATGNGLLVERAAILRPPGTGTIAVGLAVSGSEKAVLAYADAVVRGSPGVAFLDWRVVAIDQASVRLSGTAVAAWR